MIFLPNEQVKEIGHFKANNVTILQIGDGLKSLKTEEWGEEFDLDTQATAELLSQSKRY